MMRLILLVHIKYYITSFYKFSKKKKSFYKNKYSKEKEKTNPIPPLLFPSKRRTQAPQILYI